MSLAVEGGLSAPIDANTTPGPIRSMTDFEFWSRRGLLPDDIDKMLAEYERQRQELYSMRAISIMHH